jgi:hypothetical protein
MRMPLKAVLAAAAIATIAAGPVSATPSATKGTISPEKPKVTWTGTGHTSSVEARCYAPVCDYFMLTIVPVAGQDVKLALDVPDLGDYDIYVYDRNGVEVAYSGNFPGEDEALRIKNPKAQTYEVEIVPYLVTPDMKYTAVATYIPKK